MHRTLISGVSEETWQALEKMAEIARQEPLELVASMVEHCVSAVARKAKKLEAVAESGAIDV